MEANAPWGSQSSSHKRERAAVLTASGAHFRAHFRTRLILPLRELLYSSQAPSVSLEHSLPPNAFEPFHAMSQTIKSRLRDVMRQQEAELAANDGMEVDGADGAITAMMKGKHNVSDYRHSAHDPTDGPAIVPALLRALCRTFHLIRLAVYSLSLRYQPPAPHLVKSARSARQRASVRNRHHPRKHRRSQQCQGASAHCKQYAREGQWGVCRVDELSVCGTETRESGYPLLPHAEPTIHPCRKSQ